MALVPVQMFAQSGTVTPLAYSATSGTAQFSQRAIGTNPGGAVGGIADPITVRVANRGAGPVWIRFGGLVNAVTTANGIMVLGSSVEIFDPGPANFIAAIGTATGDLNISTGIGAR